MWLVFPFFQYRIVSVSDTPCYYLVGFNSISNTGWASKKTCPNELKFCELSQNPKSLRCRKFQLNTKMFGSLENMLHIETLKSKTSDFSDKSKMRGENRKKNS